MTEAEIEAVARVIWREREIGFPPRVRRPEPDAFDRESGAWDACIREARAAIAALDAARAEAGCAMSDSPTPEIVITEEMIAAGCAELDGNVARDIYEGFANLEDVVAAIYRVMIAAAPDRVVLSFEFRNYALANSRAFFSHYGFAELP